MRAARRWAAAGAVVVAITAAALYGPSLVRRLAFFRVRQVEVIGVRYLDESDVVRRLGLRAGASVFDRIAPLQVAANAVPGVTSATVERVVPGTLRVTVREAIPVAIVPDSGQVRLVDSLGHILPFDPTRAPASLPLATRDAATAALLSRLVRIDPALYAAIESARLDHGDVVLELGARHILLRPDADATTLRSVTLVLGYLNDHTVAWRELDARFRDRVFVQKGAA